MGKTKTRRWDVAMYLRTEADMDAYLKAALEDGDAAVIAAAVDDVARARRLSRKMND